MMKRKFQRAFTPSGLCLFGAIVASPQVVNQAFAASADYTLAVTAQAEYIENPLRQPDGENEEELLSQVMLQAGIDRSTQRFSTLIDYTARKLDYKDDLLADRSLITGSSAFRWSPAEIFAWNLNHRRSFQQVDSLLPDITDNRQVVEITSTGPELTFQLTGADRITSQYNYSWANYEDEDLPGQERQQASVQYTHAFSGRLTSFINLDALKSEFNSDQAPEFERYNYSLGSTYTAEQFGVTLEAGESKSRVQAGPDQSGLLLKADANYTLNSLSSFTAFYSRSMEDMFSNLQTPSRFYEQDFIDDRLGNSNLTQIYKQTQYGVGYTYARPESVTFSTEYGGYERTYSDPAFNQDDRRLSMTVSLPVSQNVDFAIYGRVSDQEFPGQFREQRRREIGARSNYRISQRLSIRLSVQAVDQNGNAVIDNYEGLNALLSLTYRHNG